MRSLRVVAQDAAATVARVSFFFRPATRPPEPVERTILSMLAAIAGAARPGKESIARIAMQPTTISSSDGKESMILNLDAGIPGDSAGRRPPHDLLNRYR